MNCKQVTKFIRERSGDQEVELRRGEGYFYFTGGKADEFYQQGVYVNKITAFTLEGWLKQYEEYVSKIS